MNTLLKFTDEIFQLCETHKVKSLYAFGSVLTEKFNENSDIDLIVDFNKFELEDYFENYYDLKYSLENVLKRPIDLLEEQAIKNPYFLQSLNQQRQLIYGE